MLKKQLLTIVLIAMIIPFTMLLTYFVLTLLGLNVLDAPGNSTVTDLVADEHGRKHGLTCLEGVYYLKDVRGGLATVKIDAATMLPQLCN